MGASQLFGMHPLLHTWHPFCIMSTLTLFLYRRIIYHYKNYITDVHVLLLVDINAILNVVHVFGLFFSSVINAVVQTKELT